jgi:hypothetical protein
LIVVTTDHGRQPTTGLHHGGQSDREREIWISTNSSGLNTYFQNEMVAIVDVLPTMIRHLNISVPMANLAEVDGVPLTGPLSIFHPMIKRAKNDLIFSWEFIGNTDEEIEIWASYNNRFRTKGKPDKYKLLAKVKGSLESWSMPISGTEKGQMKVLIKGKYNSVNKWLVASNPNE